MQYVKCAVRVLLLAAALCCGIAGCGKTAQEGNSDKPAVQPEASAAAERTPEASAAVVYTPEDAARAAYSRALSDLLDKHVLPDGTDGGYDPLYDMAENQFAIYDVDQDGAEELILQYVTAVSAGQVQYVFGYDQSTGQLRTELQEYPLLTFYDNGVVKAGWSHNQGLGGEFWPYTLYRYDAKADSYVSIAMVDAWDKGFAPTDSQGTPFPDSVDISGTGIVYYITITGEEASVAPADKTVYEAWYNGYLGDAAEVRIPYLPLKR